MSVSTTVIKVGGSLLSVPHLGARLVEQIAACDGQVLMVIGGGDPANTVRDWDRLQSLGEERSHWLAIDAMSLTARLVECLLPRSRIVRTRAEVDEVWRSGGVPILEPRIWIEFFEAQSSLELPHTWSVTSDSIAAWLAICWPADRLLMLKSIDRPDQLAAAPGVDAHFAALADRIPRVDWVNLRASSGFSSDA